MLLFDLYRLLPVRYNPVDEANRRKEDDDAPDSDEKPK